MFKSVIYKVFGILCLVMFGICMVLPAVLGGGDLILWGALLAFGFGALGVYLLVKSSEKKADENFINKAPKFKEKIVSLGVDISNCKNPSEYFYALHHHSHKVLRAKERDLKLKYEFDEINPRGIAFGKKEIVYNITYKNSKYYNSCYPHNEETIDNIVKLWNFDNEIGVLKYSDIEHFEVKGSIRYDTKIHGGGVNIDGAVTGALLFGEAGAVVGSKVGTEVSSTTEKVDDRVLLIHAPAKLKDDLIVATGANVDDALLELRKKIPNKEYSFEKGYKASSPSRETVSNDSKTNQSKNEKTKSTSPKKSTVSKKSNSKLSYNDELIKLKELLDMGIITQEEFDAKKKQLLGL